MERALAMLNEMTDKAVRPDLQSFFGLTSCRLANRWSILGLTDGLERRLQPLRRPAVSGRLSAAGLLSCDATRLGQVHANRRNGSRRSTS